MTFESYTNDLFFKAPVYKFDKTVLAFLRKEKRLNEFVYDGWTVYPPLSALREEESQRYIFGFKSHPEAAFTFREGEIELTVRKSNRKNIYVPVLKFIFNRKEDGQKALQFLTSKFKKTDAENEKRSKHPEFRGEEYQVNLYYGKGDVLANGYILLVLLSKYLE